MPNLIYHELVAGTPSGTDIFTFEDLVAARVKKITLDDFISLLPTGIPTLEQVLTAGSTLSSDHTILINSGQNFNIFQSLPGPASHEIAFDSDKLLLYSDDLLQFFSTDTVEIVPTVSLKITGLGSSTYANVLYYDSASGEVKYGASPGGTADRFGYPAEDTTTDANRSFNMSGFEFAIVDTDFQFVLSNTGKSIHMQVGNHVVSGVAYSYDFSLPTGGLPYWQILATNDTSGETSLVQSAPFAGNPTINFQMADSTGNHSIQIFSSSGIYLSSSGYANTKVYAQNLPAMSVETNILFYDPGTGQVKYGSATGGGVGVDTNFAITDLTATGNRTHTFADKTVEITFNSLGGASGLKLSSTSTAAASNLQKVLEITLSGANATGGQITYTLAANNTHTGGGSNYGAQFAASGGINNFGVFGIAGTGGSVSLPTASGVLGFSPSGFGVYGIVNTGTGVTGVAYTSGATNSIGVDGSSDATFGIGVRGLGTTGVLGMASSGKTPVMAESISNVNNTVETVLAVYRNTDTTGNPGDIGIGGSISFFIATNNLGNNTNRQSNQLISKWTNATYGTVTSKFIITGVNSAVTADLFTLSGSGALQLNKYGIASFTGTPAYTLQVDASGNLIEGTPGAGSVSGKFYAAVSNTNNSGSNPETLLTVTIPANALANNGDSLIVRAGSNFLTSSGTKQIGIKFNDGTNNSVLNRNPGTAIEDQVFTFTIVRQDSTHIVINGNILHGLTLGDGQTVERKTWDFTQPLVITIIAIQGVANDIIARYLTATVLNT